MGSTVGRIHLRLSVISSVAAGDGFAIGIVRGQGVDVGVTIAGAPHPISDPYEDWLYYSNFAAGFGGAANPSYFPGQSNILYVDIKSKRKLEELTESLNIVTQVNNAAAGSLPHQVDYSASVLLLLP